MTNKIQFPGLKPLGAPDETAPAVPPAGQRSAPLDPANPLAGIGTIGPDDPLYHQQVPAHPPAGSVLGDRLIGPGNDDYGRQKIVMPEATITPADMEAAVNAAPPEVVKALEIIQRAIFEEGSFIVLGIKPTKTGADFFTALHGNPDDLLAAHGDLQGVIDRLYTRKGIRLCPTR